MRPGDIAALRQHHADREIRHRLGVASLDIEDHDAALGGLGDVDIFNPRARHAGNAQLRHGIEHLGRNGNEQPGQKFRVLSMLKNQRIDYLDFRSFFLHHQTPVLKLRPTCLPIADLGLRQHISQILLRGEFEFAAQNHGIPNDQGFDRFFHSVPR